MNAVGIDVSKGKSTVTVLQPFGVVIAEPFDAFSFVGKNVRMINSIMILMVLVLHVPPFLVYH